MSSAFISYGDITLPNSLKLAYKLWSNAPNARPEQVERKNGTDGAAGVAAPPAADSDEQLNILAVHGRHDNAGSWDHLLPLFFKALPSAFSAPALPPRRVNVLCLDLPGHGLSDWRPADSTYGMVHNVSDLHQLLLQLNWREFLYLGHSYGGVVGQVLLGAQAIMLPHPHPAVKPPPLCLGYLALDPLRYENWRIRKKGQRGEEILGTDGDYSSCMTRSGEGSISRALEERYLLLSRERPLYPTIQAAVSAYKKNIPDIDDASVETLLVRGTRRVKRRKTTLSNSSTTASLSESSTTAAPLPTPSRRSSDVPFLPDTPLDPSTEQAGYVFSFDPLLNSFHTAEISRSQIRTAAGGMSAGRIPASIMFFQTQEQKLDEAFQRHAREVLAGILAASPPAVCASEVKSSNTSSSSSATAASTTTVNFPPRSVAILGSHHLHLDSPSRVLAPLLSFISTCWIARTETRQARQAFLFEMTKKANHEKEQASQTERKTMQDNLGRRQLARELQSQKSKL